MAAIGLVAVEGVGVDPRQLDIGDDAEGLADVGGDARGYVALHRKHFAGFKGCLVALAPTQRAGFGVEQQRRNDHGIAGDLHAGLEKIIDFRLFLLAQGSGINSPGQRKHRQPIEFRQHRDEFSAKSDADIILAVPVGG